MCKKCCWQPPFLLQGTVKVYHSTLLMFSDKCPWNISEISKRSIKEHKNCGVLYIFDPPPTKSPLKCSLTCVPPGHKWTVPLLLLTANLFVIYWSVMKYKSWARPGQWAACCSAIITYAYNPEPERPTGQLYTLGPKSEVELQTNHRRCFHNHRVGHY